MAHHSLGVEPCTPPLAFCWNNVHLMIVQCHEPALGAMEQPQTLQLGQPKTPRTLELPSAMQVCQPAVFVNCPQYSNQGIKCMPPTGKTCKVVVWVKETF